MNARRSALARGALALLPIAAPLAGAAAQDTARAMARSTSQAAGTLVGWVTDRETCEPVAGAQVLVSSGRRAVTDDSGRFAVGDLPADTYTVVARRIGYSQSERDSVEVQGGRVSDVNLQVRRASSNDFGRGESVVVDSANNPVAPAAADTAPPVVTWSPSAARQGALLTITVRDTTVPWEWRGELAGEPLHFTEGRRGVRRALAGIPVDAGDTVVLSLQAAGHNGLREIRVSIPVARGEFRMERLTVAPRFGTPPDSALSERLARESMLARRVSCRSHQRERLWRPPFVRPRPGRVTSPFGGARLFNGAVQSRHMGTDFAGAVGAPIRATNRGVVALVGDFYLGGRVVYVDHGAGLVSAYLHMSRRLVSEGDTVRAGQVIGRVGATGRVTGPHLHWIVRYGGVTVDPMSVFTAGTSGEGRVAR